MSPQGRSLKPAPSISEYGNCPLLDRVPLHHRAIPRGVSRVSITHLGEERQQTGAKKLETVRLKPGTEIEEGGNC